MEERSTGLILRTRPLTETSLIVQWLTPNLGRIATVAKGARRAKSSFRGKLDLFFLADFSFQRSRRSELHNLREVMLRETFPELRKSLGAITQASYAAELIELTTETETPIAGAFQLFGNLLSQLVTNPPQALTIFAFEMKWLANLGLSPEFDTVRLMPGTRQILERLSDAEWSWIARIKLTEAQTLEMARFLQNYLTFHLERIPRERQAAIEAD